MNTGGGWILEVDLRKFFDTLEHGHLRTFLQRRVRDGVLLRLIGKWLNAGVFEDGCIRHPDSGSPQGGVVSPILSNVFLHYVLDAWFEEEVKPRLRGPAFLIRYADDFVIGLTLERDARRVMEVLPKRFAKFGLTVHPTKTKLVPFRRPRDGYRSRGGSNGDGPGTFDFLGFTHAWSRSRKGNWIVKRKTASDRYTRAVRTIAQWCRLNRHRPIAEQHEVISRKLRGHYAYYGITGNSYWLSRFREDAARVWRKWLVRRRGGNRRPWSWFRRLQERYRLPPAVTIHSTYRTRSERIT